MNIDCYELVEHFDYMKGYIPQPFYIPSDTIKSFSKTEDGYTIETNKFTYTLTTSCAKKLVDALGIKIKLFANDDNEAYSVIEQVIPAINKLLKCFSDCFVFYSSNDDHLEIIDLNVNTMKGAEGTKYENGPSPWKVDLKKNSTFFTCFTTFIDTFGLDGCDGVMVKADDIMATSSQVSISLFKPLKEGTLQPMLSFNSKFSNMKGFADIHPVILDSVTGINISFPMNYSREDQLSFDELWEKVKHLYSSLDMNDFIIREINELAASKETPGSIKSFISSLLVDSIINVNQPIGSILTEANTITAQMKPAKAAKFKKQLGALIGWCLCMRHSSCSSCGHIDLV